MSKMDAPPPRGPPPQRDEPAAIDRPAENRNLEFEPPPEAQDCNMDVQVIIFDKSEIYKVFK